MLVSIAKNSAPKPCASDTLNPLVILLRVGVALAIAWSFIGTRAG